MSEDQNQPSQPETEVQSPAKKAYDFADLGSKLKDAGLELAENAAAKVVLAVIEWVEESAKITATPFDNMALKMLPNLKEYVLSQVDKIDSKHAQPAPEAPKAEA